MGGVAWAEYRKDKDGKFEQIYTLISSTQEDENLDLYHAVMGQLEILEWYL